MQLHRWVAALLLHRGQLAFARAVIEEIPKSILHQERLLAALRDRLKVLEEAERHGAVFPKRLPRSQWWRNPELLQPESKDGQPRVWWKAGQIEEKDENILYCLVGWKETGTQDEKIFFERIELGRDHFEEACPDVSFDRIRSGQFFEYGAYGEQQRLVIRVHPPGQMVESLIYPKLDPRRYLKRNPDADPTQ